ncbi:MULTISPECIES: hypothetical protein [Arsenicicoccus]|uniref:hypothetical protein n=1 Tax=Arsenicicoccus TaxID=267408 RepID=UPI00257C2342|nr:MULTISPECIES: hypothetical protein [Arsenicicoccus]
MTKRSAGIASGPLRFGEQGVERFCEFGFESHSNAVVVVGQDQDLLEEGLVEQPPDVLRCAGVSGVAVGREVERPSQVALDDLPLLVGGIEFGLDTREAFADPVLFLPEEVDRDRARVVGFHELAALPGQLLLLLLERHAEPLHLAAGVGQFGTHLGLDVGAERRVDLDLQVEVLHLAFDLVDQH